MKKSYQATLHGKLLLIIMTATLPTIIFTLVALSYLVYTERQHSREVLMYRSYFSKEVGIEMLYLSGQSMILLVRSVGFSERNWHDVYDTASSLVKNSSIFANIMIVDEDNTVMMQVDDGASWNFGDNRYPIYLVDQEYEYSVGSLIYFQGELVIPFILNYREMHNGEQKYYQVIVFLDWENLLDHISLDDSYYSLSNHLYREDADYTLFYVDKFGKWISLLAMKDPLLEAFLFDRQKFYELNVYNTKDKRYIVKNEILYHYNQSMLVLAISQATTPWYNNLWYIMYLMGIILILVTLIATLFGYLLFKKFLLSDIEEILLAVNEVGKGNFVARAEVRDEEFLGLLARGVNHMAELIAVQTDALKRAAHTDGLTGIHNRRYFWEHAERILSKDSQHAVILFDIDHFKLFNDNHGHAVGDAVLIHVAQVVKHNLRKEDLFARYGGEEFIILLPHFSLDRAIYVAEKIRLLIEEHQFRLDSDEILHITVSLGLTLSQDGEDIPLEALVMNADMALYQAKQAGRNQYALLLSGYKPPMIY
ncbi:diguanylate cyclase [Entomospira entomophila]|uniref:diguanylate cyclase n=1 Tax=Entomospira entomophila TaxID=2719988 RepID=A0A968KSW8_9SPIO|nr:GGDEF domain-containing protein [Entomospira entomophilus]NIZ40802.1 diguanylate cyclase [Entomospira entomophilus]WDI35014.1 diguanylate cyclase [Entomospira entomophilus]